MEMIYFLHRLKSENCDSCYKIICKDCKWEADYEYFN